MSEISQRECNMCESGVMEGRAFCVALRLRCFGEWANECAWCIHGWKNDIGVHSEGDFLHGFRSVGS